MRLQVLDCLVRERYPISQPDLARLPGLEACDRVTLYRTLKLLRSAGLVHTVQGIDGTWRFCAHELKGTGCPGNHPHFLCQSCGGMICLIAQMLPHVGVPPAVLVRGKQLVVYGLCGACAAKDRSKNPARNAARLSGSGIRRRSRA